jgi:hypothetical protein
MLDSLPAATLYPRDFGAGFAPQLTSADIGWLAAVAE